MQKYLIIGAALIAALYIMLSEAKPSLKPSATKVVDSASAVSMVDGKQVIAIAVNKGYSPNRIEARAGVPTVLSFQTQNTFDCSTALIIPSLNVRKQLKPTEKFDVPLELKTGDVLRGSCSMGMYDFSISFK
jgi:plastocyanin domain-containing protein